MRVQLNALVIGGVAITFSCTCVSDHSEAASSGLKISMEDCGAVASEHSCLEAIPTRQLSKHSQMRVQFYVMNHSSSSVGYWKPWSYAGYWAPWHLELLDCETEERVAYLENKAVPLSREDTIELKPGEAIFCDVPLLETFGVDGKAGNLPAGRYALRAVCSIKENDELVKVGCTPMEMNQTIMLIEIVERYGWSGGWGGLDTVHSACWLALLAAAGTIVGIALRYWRQHRGGATLLSSVARGTERDFRANGMGDQGETPVGDIATTD